MLGDSLVSILKNRNPDAWFRVILEIHRTEYHGTDGDFFGLLADASTEAFELAYLYVRMGAYLQALGRGDPDIVALARSEVVRSWVYDLLRTKDNSEAV